MTLTRKLVYYDPDYPSRWIDSNLSKEIKQSLTNRGFEIKNAKEIRDEMLSVIQNQDTQTVIVFSQDVAPDTILDDFSATALVRQYLDKGGSIIWLGDIPFFNQGAKGKEIVSDWWKKGSAASILNMNPVFAFQITTSEVTSFGSKLGINTKWTGIRPIFVDNDMKVITRARCYLGSSFLPTAPQPWWKSILTKITGINLGVGQVNLGLHFDKEKDISLEQNTFYSKNVANAWFKNFDNSRPKTGFIRLWDYRP